MDGSYRPWHTEKPTFDMRMLDELVGNVMTSRSDFFRNLLDPRRNIEDECGYPRLTDAVDVEMYRQLYDRDAIANRVVQVMPKESWREQPLVYEHEGADEITDFERAWDDLGKDISPGASWHKEEKGSLVWEHLLRADIRSGIGHFGVLLLGIDDGRNLQDPADGVAVTNDCRPTANEVERMQALDGDSKYQVLNSFRSTYGTDAEYSPAGFGMEGTVPPGSQLSGTDQQYFGVQFGPTERPSQEPSKQKRRLLFLRSFDESLVQIVRYEWNIRNPRFGMPVMYRITLNDPREQHSGVGLPLATVYVHWSRVLHLADNLGASEIFGDPRMRPVLERILDLRKLYGGSAEMFWRGAFPGLSLETVPQLGGDVIVDPAKTRDVMEQYFNGLQRYLLLTGMTAKTLAPTVADPASQIQVQIEAICVQLTMPIRVFKGSERGEQASIQDDSNWIGRVAHRQDYYITPRVIVPFIDRLILLGVLPEPKEKLTENVGVWRTLNRTRVVEVYNADTGTMQKRPQSSTSRAMTTPGGYTVEWPDLDTTSDKDKAGILLQRTQAYAAYIAGNMESVVGPKDFMTKFDSMNEETADAIIDEAKDSKDTMTMPPAGGPGHPATPPPKPLIKPPPTFPQAGAPGGAPTAKPPAPPKALPTPATQPPKPPTTNEVDLYRTYRRMLS